MYIYVYMYTHTHTIFIYIYNTHTIHICIYRKNWRGSNTWEPASSFSKELLDEYYAQQATRKAKRVEKRKQAVAEVAKQYTRRASGPTQADRVTAVAKEYEAAGLDYWRAHDKAVVDVMASDAAKASAK